MPVVLVVSLLLGLPVMGALVLLAQGRYARVRTPRLAEAGAPTAGVEAGAEPMLRVLLVGESTVAGVGAADHETGLAGRTAKALGTATGQAVAWRAIGRSGVTAGEMAGVLSRQTEPLAVDAVVLVFGVNDTVRLHGRRQWVSDLERLIRAVRRRAGDVPILLAGVPPMGKFPALPQPLRIVLGLRARALDRGAMHVAAMVPRVRHAPTTIDDATDLAPDGYHPGPRGYARWGNALGRTLGGMLTGGTVPPPPDRPVAGPALSRTSSATATPAARPENSRSAHDGPVC